MTESGPGAGRAAAPGRRFRPTFWSSLAALVGIAILLGLGTWQVQRLHWKEALIADRSGRMTAAAVELPGDLSSPEDIEHRRFAVTGRFLHDRELYLGSKAHRGQVGFRIVTPFELDDGRLLMIDRGWVPAGRKAPESRSAGQIEGRHALVGLARREGWHGSAWFRPENEPGDNYWLWVDLSAMAAQIGRPDLITGIYLLALDDGQSGRPPGGLPIGHSAELRLRNDHLQYAITWYALAAALAAIYVAFSYRVR